MFMHTVSFFDGLIKTPTYYWTFDNADVQANRVRDLFGSAPGTIINATTGVAGQVGEAVSFASASNTWVEFPTQPLSFNNESWSISFWWKPDDVSTGGQPEFIINTRGSGTAGTVPGVRFSQNDDDIQMFIEDTGGDTIGGLTAPVVIGSAVLSAGVWTHVVVTFDNGTGEVTGYIDGSQTYNSTTGALAAGDFTPVSGRGAVLGLGRIDATLEFKANGDVCEVGVWRGYELTEYEVKLLYAKQNAGERGIRANFDPEPVVGAPFADYNAEGLSVGALSSWTNDGSDATGDLGTNPGSTGDPTVVNDGDGPVPGAKYVAFDGTTGGGDALQGGLTTTRTTGVVFAAVVRATNASGNTNQQVFDGDDVTNRMSLFKRPNSNQHDWAIFSGTSVGSATHIESNRWVRVVGRFGSDGLLSVERATRASGSNGTNSLDGITIGSNYTGGNLGSYDLARLVLWDDGTTMLEAEQWLERAYPFEAVPPGNPLNDYDPNSLWVSSIPYIPDHGSENETLTCDNLAIGADPDCPEQVSFDFNGTNSRAYDDGGLTVRVQPYMVSAPIRFEATGTEQSLFGWSTTSANSGRLYVASDNAVRIYSAPTTATGDDYDTFAPFNNVQRWSTLQGRFAGANSDTWIDGVSAGGHSISTDARRSIALGARHNGASWGAHLNGRMGRVLFYYGSSEANASRAAEVEEWLQRHYRLATQPGAPFVDSSMTLDNVTLNGADVSDLVNDGSASNFTQTTTNRQPLWVADDGPEVGVGFLPDLAPSSIDFQGLDNDGTPEYMDTSSTFTAETQPVTALVVFKVTAFPTTNDMVLGASATGSTACQTRIDGSDNSKINAGTALATGTAVTLNVWHWQAAEFNSTTSHVSDSEGNSASGDAGTESHGTIHRLGQSPALNGHGGQRQARHIYWGDGTTWEEAEEYARRRYPNIDPY